MNDTTNAVAPIRKKPPFILISILALMLGVALAVLVFSEGERLPEFTTTPLTTIDGKQLGQRDLQGKVVMVNFWATSCTSCVAEMPHLKQLYQDYRDQGFELIAVAMPYDQRPLVEKFRESRALPFPVVHDENNHHIPRFGRVTVTPTFMIYDRRGNKQYSWIGPMADEKLRKTLSDLLRR